MSATLVLVHGGWSGGWIWGDVKARLEEQGRQVVAVDRLPSAGTDPDRLGDLADSVAALREVVDDVGAPVALVAHSSGGMVVTELGDHPAVVHSVYVAAFWPEPGQKLVDLMVPPAFALPPQGAAIAMTDDVELLRETVAADVDPETMAKLRPRYVLESLTHAISPSTAPARPSHPTTYVVCTEDRTIDPALQEQFAAKADRRVHLASSHSPMLSVPGELAAVLLDALS